MGKRKGHYPAYRPKEAGSNKRGQTRKPQEKRQKSFDEEENK
jgi:hypothetical protein